MKFSLERGPARRRGAALFLLLFALLLGTAGLFLQGVATSPRPAVAEAEVVLAVLGSARQALLAHALSYPERHSGRMGVLPCPQRRSGGLLPSGSAAGTCGARYVDAFGLLPWRSLGLPPPSFCVLYLVSGVFKPYPAAYMLNEDSPGTLRLYGRSGDEFTGRAPRRRGAAVLLAPGLGRGDPQCRAFEEARRPGLRLAAVAGGESELRLGVTRERSASYPAGELALVLGDEAIFSALRKRGDFAGWLYAPTAPNNLGRQVAECLLRFATTQGSFPWPAPLVVADVRRNASYDDRVPLDPSATPALTLFGRVPDIADDSLGAMGRPRGQRVLTSCGEFSNRNSALRRFWENWKDHLYYAVAGSYQPGAPSPPPGCADCIQLRGAPLPAYVAVLIYAGSQLPGQDRRSSPDPGDYLEGENRSAAQRGHARRMLLEARTPGDDFNDVLYCIRPPGEVPRIAPCPLS